MKKIILSTLFILTIYFTFGEIIILKDHTVIKGKIVERYKDIIIVKTNNGKLTVDRSEIIKEYDDEEQFIYEENSINKTINDNKKSEIKKNIKESEDDNSNLDALKKKAENIENKLFWSGFSVSCLSPYVLIFSGITLNFFDPGMFPFALIAAFTTSGLGTIPYGGPIALGFIYTAFSISFFALSQHNYTYPIFLPLGFASLLIVTLEIIACILEFSSKPAAKNYYNKNKKKFTVFLYPDIPLNKKDETSIVGGFTYRF